MSQITGNALMEKRKHKRIQYGRMVNVKTTQGKNMRLEVLDYSMGGMGLVNTTHFTGFPTVDNYYASAQPNPSFFADILLVVTQITPK